MTSHGHTPPAPASTCHHGTRRQHAQQTTFDRWKQDQTVALQYSERNGRYSSGFAITDRPAESLLEIADLLTRLRGAASASERTRLTQEVLAAQPGYAQRMFAGRNSNEDATMELKDAEGRNRLVLSVSPEGQARIQFLDENGDTVREITP
ncbi:MAG: hypothetical protein F4137_03345 [Acidobacteria bacterium]|nr:hypothetical protein [Acidobacteriota bacterium]